MGYLNWCQETLVDTPTEWMLNCGYFSHVPHIQPIWSLQQYNIMTRVWVDLWPHLKTHNEFGKINYIPLLNQLFVSLVPRPQTKVLNKLSTLPYPRSVYLELGNKSLNLIIIIIMVRLALGNCIKIWQSSIDIISTDNCIIIKFIIIILNLKQLLLKLTISKLK